MMLSRFAVKSPGLCGRLAKPYVPHHVQPTTIRSFSAVVNLSDGEAVEKFRMINQKSVLYFTANWCGPCKMIKPLFEDMSKKYTGIAFGKVDIDDNDAAAVDFEISAVPTFILFDGENAVDRFTGADSNKLEKCIRELDQRQ